MPQNKTADVSVSCVRTVHVHWISEMSAVLFCGIHPWGREGMEKEFGGLVSCWEAAFFV